MDICLGELNKTELAMSDIDNETDAFSYTVRFASTRLHCPVRRLSQRSMGRWPSKANADIPGERGLALGMEQVRTSLLVTYIAAWAT